MNVYIYATIIIISSIIIGVAITSCITVLISRRKEKNNIVPIII